MHFNFRELKNNLSFFLLTILGVVAVLLLSAFSTLFTASSINMPEIELAESAVRTDKLIINEVMTANKGVCIDEEGNTADYLELYNGHDAEINLLNYGLSDGKEVKWTFPDITIAGKSYLVIFLNGSKVGGLNANFKLKSSGGERLALYKPNGKIIDALDTVAVKSNTVIARDGNGQWTVQTIATPGFANTKEGLAAFRATLESEEAPSIVINELLANNKGQFKDNFGDYSGFIELKNITDKTIDLDGYRLSNDENVNFKWRLPAIKLKPQGIIGVYTSNRNTTENGLHASFKLNSGNGMVTIADKSGKIIDKVTYTSLANGFAYARNGDQYFATSKPSMGQENDAAGIAAFEKQHYQRPEGLIINEAMNNNYAYLKQNSGEYYDWLELYNNSAAPINLHDYYLATGTDDLQRYRLPDVTLDKGEYYLLIASGDTNLSNNTYQHTDFKISRTQALFLSKDKQIVDALFVAEVPLGYSIGKDLNGGICYYEEPSPGQANKGGVRSITAAPLNSLKSAVYDDVAELTIEIKGCGQTYYTVNGSEPNSSSKLYSSPLKLKKTTVLKLRSYEDGKLPSDVSTYSYIINEKHRLPIISLSLKSRDFKEIYNNPWVEGIEKKVTTEFFVDGERAFNIDAGIRLFGGSARGYAKKSFQLKFRKEYGAGHLHYQVFKNRDFASFNSLVLRTGSQDELESNENSPKKALIRDLFTTALVEEYTAVDVQAYRPAVLYINGEYYGIYFIREKIDEDFVASHYNLVPDKKKTDLLRIDGQVKAGNRDKFYRLYDFIESHPLNKAENYAQVKEKIDIVNLIDFWIAECWTANNDIVNTRYFSHPDIDNGRWKFIFYDLDYGVYNVDHNYYRFMTNPNGLSDWGFDNYILRSLMKAPEFRQTFAERLAYNLKNTWDRDVVLKKIDDIITEIGYDEIKRNYARWNLSYRQWEEGVEFIKDYARNRNKYLVKFAQSFLHLTDAEMKEYFTGVK